MKKSDFYFELPDELIAQTPIENREQSRLLHLSRQTGAITHYQFTDLPKLLNKGDCLVLNDSRVMPARLLGTTEKGSAAEVLLLSGRDDNTWECLVRPGRKIKTGVKLVFGAGELTAEVVDESDDGNRLIKFSFEGIFMEVLERLGKAPLPPYIHEELEDKERYQTVYSREVGSAAAPTAGLHFTHELLDKLKRQGIQILYLTLHVGLGTFRPVKTEDVKDHKMHEEKFIVSDETLQTIEKAKAAGNRVIAVGTTSCRVLESVYAEKDSQTSSSDTNEPETAANSNAESSQSPEAEYQSTDIFIYPGFEFKCIDGLITNFHLPESTLIMLVSAFSSRENILKAYEEAIREKYRFFSFGDAMLIV